MKAEAQSDDAAKKAEELAEEEAQRKREASAQGLSSPESISRGAACRSYCCRLHDATRIF